MSVSVSVSVLMLLLLLLLSCCCCCCCCVWSRIVKMNYATRALDDQQLLAVEGSQKSTPPQTPSQQLFKKNQDSDQVTVKCAGPRGRDVRVFKCSQVGQKHLKHRLCASNLQNAGEEDRNQPQDPSSPHRRKCGQTVQEHTTKIHCRARHCARRVRIRGTRENIGNHKDTQPPRRMNISTPSVADVSSKNSNNIESSTGTLPAHIAVSAAALAREDPDVLFFFCNGERAARSINTGMTRKQHRSHCDFITQRGEGQGARDVFAQKRLFYFFEMFSCCVFRSLKIMSRFWRRVAGNV